MTQRQTSRPSRRSFITKSGGLAVGLAAHPGLLARAQEVKPKAEAAPAKDEPPPSPVDCAVIGLGDQGREIVRALAALPGANVTLLCDGYEAVHKRSLERAPKATAVTDYRRVLDDKNVRAVWVATPTHQHREIVVAALEAGKHVYCEAPLAHTAADANAIAQAAVRHPKQVFQAGLQRRANPLETHVFGFFRTGVLSKVAMARAQYSKKTSWRRPAATKERQEQLDWRLDPKVSTGLLGEIGIHQIDVASYFLRAQPVSVTGFGGVMTWRDGRQVPDTVQAVFEYPGGLRLLYGATLGNSFQGSSETFQGSDAAVLLQSDRAWMIKEADAPNLGWEVYATKESLVDQTGIALVANATKLLDEGLDPSENKNAYTKGALYYAAEGFLASVRASAKSVVGWKEGYNATIVALKANEAILKGSKVTFRKEWFAA
jgi:predicted dehydrogenase